MSRIITIGNDFFTRIHNRLVRIPNLFGTSGAPASNAYLLEAGTDHYQLEDSSGNYAID